MICEGFFCVQARIKRTAFYRENSEDTRLTCGEAASSGGAFGNMDSVLRCIPRALSLAIIFACSADDPT